MAATQISIIADFVRGVQSACSLEDAVDVLHEATHRVGYRRVVYAKGRLPSGRGALPSRANIIARNFPGDWEDVYDRLGQFDPYFRVPCHSMNGTEWTFIQSHAKSFSKPVREFIDWTHRLGLRNGYTVPVRISPTQYAAVSAIDLLDDFDAQHSEKSKDLIALIANFFINQVSTKFEGLTANPVVLSKRERECLFWSAQGKATEDIATILAISPETVRIYFKRVTSKLDAANRTHALAKAVSLGLIEMSFVARG
jgi:DNA-binding CsgD family transcriptional regulator